MREVLGDRWDMMIAHPVCRRLANSGVRWLHERPAYWDDFEEAVEFYSLFVGAAHIPLRAIENPVWHRYAIERLGGGRSFIHPYHLGAPFKKLTGWQLFGLKPLQKIFTLNDYPDGGVTEKCWKMPPSPDREMLRAETEPEVAMEIARQWA